MEASVVNCQIDEIRSEALKAIKVAKSADDLRELSVKYLGRKGVITQFLRSIAVLPLEDRAIVGQRANEIKKIIKYELDCSMACVNDVSTGRTSEMFDVSLPGRRRRRGHLHPITEVMSRICGIFSKMGFSIVDGPEIESEYYNFEALNLLKSHPARDMQDTFYVGDEIVLRTHTSSVQPRIMELHPPPVHILVPGKVYRCDSDATHTPMFHQVEGLFVDKSISFADLKGVVTTFVYQMFGKQTKLRFRPSFFPFTEPSAEVDIACVICGGSGCRICSQNGWLEILGAGMVHPCVFENVGYDTSEYTGFAFGVGVERIAMLKYRNEDIRKYFDNDFAFLSQF